MYGGTGVMFPYFQNSPLETQQFDDFNTSNKLNASLGMPSSFIQTSAVSEYDLGGDGDLFKAPEPVMENPFMCLDPMATAFSMISCGEDVMPTQSMSASDIEFSMESGQLLSEVFYECQKDILAKEGKQTPLSEVLSIQVPSVKTDESLTAEKKLLVECPFQKSVSSSCLRSMDCMPEAPPRPNFLDFPGMNFGAVYGMRRAFSEGDIQTLGNGNINHNQSSPSPREQPMFVSSCSSEDRKEKLLRYRNKKSKRNFGRKIKYACRKALADSQPRIRGRFAKNEEPESSKK